MLRLILCVLASIVGSAAPAFADLEFSEHTAVLVGDPRDTLGFNIVFTDTDGWSMTVRTKPGAQEQTVRLGLPKSHAHYLAYVAPGRASITFVELGGGRTDKRTKLGAGDGLAWLFAPDGTRLASWTYGQVFSPADLAAFRTTISHLSSWGDDHQATKAGLEITTSKGKRTVVLDPTKRTFK